MRRSLIGPAAGLLVAIAITATMDATGYIAFSALPLCPLLALFWYLDRLSRRDAGRGNRALVAEGYATMLSYGTYELTARPALQPAFDARAFAGDPDAECAEFVET